jgi:SOS-response transcriptional repressor LexA
MSGHESRVNPLAEIDINTLARFVGRAVVDTDAELDGPIDEPFIDWWVREARTPARRQPALSDDDAAARGSALMARVQARAFGVTLATHAPALDSAPVRGRATQVLRAATARGAAPLVDLGVAAGTGRELWDEVVDQWITVDRALPAGRYLALRIVGDSMTPLMHTGDTVLVRLDAPVRRDSIIIARHPDDGYVCKRVQMLTESVVVLASLAPDRPLITVPRDASCLVGAVVAVWCAHHEPAPHLAS